MSSAEAQQQQNWPDLDVRYFRYVWHTTSCPIIADMVVKRLSESHLGTYLHDAQRPIGSHFDTVPTLDFDSFP
jgi:hypothetical protein